MDPHFLMLVSTLSALIALGAALFTGRSWPIVLRKRLDALEGRQVQAEAIVERVESSHLARMAEFEALREEIGALLDSVERKRRSMAASAAKLANGGQEPVEMTTDREELVRLARSQGYRV